MRESDEPTDLPPVFIRERMKVNGVRAKALAEAMTTSEVQISRLLSGKRKLSLEWLFAFAKALEVPIQSLFAPPVKGEREQRIHDALLLYGVDSDDLTQVVSLIDTFVPKKVGGTREQNVSHDRSQFANPHHAKEPS